MISYHQQKGKNEKMFYKTSFQNTILEEGKKEKQSPYGLILLCGSEFSPDYVYYIASVIPLTELPCASQEAQKITYYRKLSSITVHWLTEMTGMCNI